MTEKQAVEMLKLLRQILAELEQIHAGLPRE